MAGRSGRGGPVVECVLEANGLVPAEVDGDGAAGPAAVGPGAGVRLSSGQPFPQYTAAHHTQYAFTNATAAVETL